VRRHGGGEKGGLKDKKEKEENKRSGRHTHCSR